MKSGLAQLLYAILAKTIPLNSRFECKRLWHQWVCFATTHQLLLCFKIVDDAK